MKHFIIGFVSSLMLVFCAILCLRLAFNSNHTATFNLNDALEYFEDDNYDIARQTMDFAEDLKKYFNSPKPVAHYPYNLGKQYGYYVLSDVNSDGHHEDGTTEFGSSTMDSDEETDFPYYQERWMVYDDAIAVQFSDGLYAVYTYVNWKHNPFTALWDSGQSLAVTTGCIIACLGGYITDLASDIIHFVGFVPYIINLE